jgi:hypothetical protein
MGFSIYYRSTRPVSDEEAESLRDAAELATAGRTWLSCEPVHFYEAQPEDDGRLCGGSKPNFSPHPDDAASAALSGLPDGDIGDLLEVLCDLSRDHQVDWEVRHDHLPEPAGYIRNGVCDPELLETAAILGDIAGIISEFEHGEPSDDELDADDRNHDDDDEGPRILRFENN